MNDVVDLGAARQKKRPLTEFERSLQMLDQFKRGAVLHETDYATGFREGYELAQSTTRECFLRAMLAAGVSLADAHKILDAHDLANPAIFAAPTGA